MMKTKKKKCQLSGLYIEANMQMGGWKAEKALILPKPHRAPVLKQGNILHLGLDKSYCPCKQGKHCFHFARLNKGVRLVAGIRMHPKMCISHILWEI